MFSSEFDEYPRFIRHPSGSTIDEKYGTQSSIKGKDRSYVQQYANLYFIRLSILKPKMSKLAAQSWNGMKVYIFLFTSSCL